MTHSAEVVRQVGRLLDSGMSQAEAARRTGVSRYTVAQWSRSGPAAVALDRDSRGVGHIPGSCEKRAGLPPPQYAYLLGLYLGDGCISQGKRGVFRLRIFLDMKYPGIIGEAFRALRAVLPNRVGRMRHPGCVEVYSSSKHWPCLFPQHGPGMKHQRRIDLEPWQEDMVLAACPGMLLRGLIHSDGSRFVNWSKGRPYPRYMFSNESPDIRAIFGRACDALGIEHRLASSKNLSVARRGSVAKLDGFVGPKK